MRTPHCPPGCLLLPRTGPIPAVPGHTPAECARLDTWPATVPVLGWLFYTPAKSDRLLLQDFNRGRRQLRAVSLLDVLDVLSRAGGGMEVVPDRVRLLLEA